MKKLMSLIIALAMIFAVSVTAFAEAPTTIDVTINDADGRTYVGYKLMDLSIDLKKDEHHVDIEGCDGTNHVDACFNYAYTVINNEGFDIFEILQQETLAYGRQDLWGNTERPTDYSLVTEKQILDYLSNMTSDSNGTYGTLRVVADRIYRAIVAANIAPTVTNLHGENTLEQGYWIIAEVTDAENINDSALSLIMLDTVGKQEVVLNPKVSLPTIAKHVKDINDSEDGDISDNAWHVSADYDIGDNVPFKLTATLPNNVRAYYKTNDEGQSVQYYTLAFHDTLATGLTLDQSSIKVYMYQTEHKAAADLSLTAPQKDVTENFRVTFNEQENKFEVRCDNILALNDVTAETAFVVAYSAQLNANATVGKAGNVNSVYLEYSNDPYKEGTGVTDVKTAIVFTYGLTINKVDSHGHALQGAKFELYKLNATNGNYELISDGRVSTNDAETVFYWNGLDDGEYRLVESEAPAGYNKMNDIDFAITAEHTTELVSLSGEYMGNDADAEGNTDGRLEQNIVNNTGTALPETGAEGTFFLITCGTLLVVVAAVFMITRKKMSIYED